MLEEARSRKLMEVGPGKPMGELLRRYWHPFAAATELEDTATKPVRLLGEDLTLYKDLSGNFGLIDRHCPHRRADLSYGFVEECGLRCNYHGWLFDHNGDCTQQPYEDTIDAGGKLRKQVKVKAYKVAAHAGLLWAYMGPDPVPLVPNYEPFTWENGFAQIVFSDIPCNWFQCQENSIDPVHFEWMHDNWSLRLKGDEGPYAAKHLEVDFSEFEHGFTYHRVREGADKENPLWTIGRVCLWPYALFTGGHFEWRVPVDDENTLSVGWFFNRVPKEREPYLQDRVPYWVSPIKDEKTGRWISSHIINQDIIGWVGQGTFAERSQENLGLSDRGIAMIRKRFFDDMDALENNSNSDPKSVIRDERENQRIDLPIVGKENFIEGFSEKELNDASPDAAARRVSSRNFPFHFGQPEEVRRAYEEAMGFKMEDRPESDMKN
ncbi:MAG: aromatic ring-hydroxylating dioxygenase subunit alpha [Rhodospirillales bacterium]|jgi:5,5'-dehydrodivanillate O-demethylase|nr:phthalate 4,5-dioxygenase [Rhodospirillaceae bacterium]MDP6429302.1 aromatic ring-hydroxylating dioxygenase subunit alpha [Rhodospirillales bacterium]MDP6643665.1 aromatic ring-hydroxylating dioxygenase subunit alpha [Rhodospirillales bacterium]MDP6840268.1 aromatic ring-hydroxylating dioxygenase subunit alpha [Rhodospirillales bacterium]|tara:strand:+ start:917 stop:2224 length:1308 start_codon:yes stop_codon:yes gene_type:complete